MKGVVIFFLEKVMFGFLCALVPPQRGVLLFGSGFGRFSDNPKFLFLHFQKNASLKPVWISSDRAEVRRLRNKGYRCLYRWSLNTFWAVVRAPIVFISHNVKDIYPVVPRRTIVINLWHGTPIKKIGFDSLRERIWIQNLVSSGRTLPYERWNYFIAASSNTTFIFEGAMRLPSAKMVPLGQPRTEPILAMMGNTSLKREIGIRLAITQPIESTKILLYTPTFRNDLSATMTIKQTLVNLDEILNKMDDKIVFFKPHPLDENIFDQTFFHDLDKVINVSSEDTQELLGIADVLITDYSSILFDFMITEKPIIAYIFDEETYISKNGGLYFSFVDLGANIAHDLSELIELVLATKNLKADYGSERFNTQNSCIKIENFIKRFRA